MKIRWTGMSVWVRVPFPAQKMFLTIKNNKKMRKEVFKLFGRVLLDKSERKESFFHMNYVAIKLGYFVPEALCYNWLYDYMTREMDVNYNSTFYKQWSNIKDKSRLELAFDQIRHYMSTYGTNFEGQTWIPNDLAFPEFKFKNLKLLEAITLEEVEEKVRTISYGKAALKSETIDFIVKNFKDILDIDKVGVRQLKMQLIDENYKFKNGQECLNWILWKWYNIDMLIKNKETLNRINPDGSEFAALDNNKKVLSTCFLRNKDVFLKFKKSEKLRPIINKIRKLAKTNHKPMPVSPWLQLNKLNDLKRLNLFRNASIFKLVQMYNALNNPTGYYVIRNGKAWFKRTIDRKVLPVILNELLLVIVSKIPKDKKVFLPKGIELAMPMSEKNFIGDIPLGSYVQCADKNTMIGIYWKNVWGARDLDLHVATIKGQILGWNASYRAEDKSILFSGDMTDAEPEATEIMWFKKELVDSIVSVSRYSGNSTYEMRVFIAQEKNTDFGLGYMVDPNNVIYQSEMTVENKSNLTLGFFKEGKFYFHSCNVGHNIIPSNIRFNILEHLVNMKYLTIREVLKMADVEIVDSPDEDTVSLNTRGEVLDFFS